MGRISRFGLLIAGLSLAVAVVAGAQREPQGRRWAMAHAAGEGGSAGGVSSDVAGRRWSSAAAVLVPA
jgi:hypothetical protein